MFINFNELKEVTIPNMNGGNGDIAAKMTVNECGRFVVCRILKGASIGLHRQETNDDINFVISGTGKAVCNGKEEILTAGVCHICPKNSEHTIINTGEDDLVIFTVVPQNKNF